MLVQLLLLPSLDYADACYLDLKEEQLNSLRKYDHVSEFRKKLKWLPIRLRRNAHILHLIYCILFNPSTPSYLKERFEFLSSSHNRAFRPVGIKICRMGRNFQGILKIPPHSTVPIRLYTNSWTIQFIRL